MNDPAHILLVDDEPSLREPLAEYLVGQGFAVTEAADAARARSLMRDQRFAIILLDIMMPGEDGLSLCRFVAGQSEIPVILITAKGEAMDRIIGLEIGADDYVVKPFDPRELVARIKTVLRRAARVPSAEDDLVQGYQFDGWTLDTVKRRLTDPDGALVPISTAEFKLLQVFAEHAGHVLNRDQLLDLAHGREAHLFDRAIDNQISRLRKKVEVDNRSPRLIKTVWGGGYTLAAKVRRLESPRHGMTLLNRLWPSSLSGRLLLTIALALLAGQLLNATLMVRAQRDQAMDRVAAEAALRLIAATDRLEQGRPLRSPRVGRMGRAPGVRLRRTELLPASPVTAGMRPAPGLVERLGAILPSYGVSYRNIAAGIGDAPPRPRRMARLAAEIGGQEAADTRLVALAAIERSDGQWLSVRVPVPDNSSRIGATIVIQTIVLYLVMLIPLVWLTRRIARSMGALRDGVAQFEITQEARPIAPTGPSDLADLTRSFNAMSARISAMLNEKDVMLGAIGHDLKTPLAALRVRVESVPDDRQRARMIASIDDITRTLDDILSLARIGRTGEAPELVNLGALVEMIADEFRDLGHDVEMADGPRIVAPLQLTWIRRALRNVIGNAVRYGARARIGIRRDAASVAITIDDDGPGIADDQIERMFEPFTRLEASRNMATGGTGLGLTLARAVAHQHGGSLVLANRRNADGSVAGLTAVLTLPVG